MEKLIENDKGDEAEEVNEEEQPSKEITLANVNKIVDMASNLSDFVNDVDPKIDRSLPFKRGLEELLQPYKELRKNLMKKMSQPTLTSFFSK